MSKQPPQTPSNAQDRRAVQPLHLVFGGELESLEHIAFSDMAALDMVGIFENYARAYDAWKEKAQATVDNAHMRYFIVHLHHLLDPDSAIADAD